jgi:hypothetical protein
VGMFPGPASPMENLTIMAATSQGMLVKSAPLYKSGGIAANSDTIVQFPTDDDNLLRFFLGLFCSDNTLGVTSKLLSSGRRMAQVIHPLFNAANGPVGIYCPCDENVQLQLEVQNVTGTVVAAAQWNVYYAVHDPNWTIGA